MDAFLGADISKKTEGMESLAAARGGKFFAKSNIGKDQHAVGGNAVAFHQARLHVLTQGDVDGLVGADAGSQGHGEMRLIAVSKGVMVDVDLSIAEVRDGQEGDLKPFSAAAGDGEIERGLGGSAEEGVERKA